MTAISPTKQKQIKKQPVAKGNAGEHSQALTDTAPLTDGAAPVAVAADPRAEEKAWLEEAELAWAQQKHRAGTAESEAEQGNRVLLIAEGPTEPVGTGKSLLVKAETVAEEDKDKAGIPNDRDSAAVAQSPSMTDGYLPVLLGGLGLAMGAGGGGGGGGGASSIANAAHNFVDGAVILGPVIAGNGLSVNLYAANGTTLLGTGVVSAAGTFSIDVGSYTGAVIAKLTNANAGNDYMDEATGAARDLTAHLMAVGVATTGTVSLNINGLTTVAATKAGAVFEGAGTVTVDTVTHNNEAVANAFGLTDLTATTVVTTIDSTGAANSAYDPTVLSAGEKYGAALAALSGMDSANGGNMQTTINQLVSGLTISGSTGTLNTATLDAIVVGARAATDMANGTGANSVVAIVSDLTMQSSASVSINDIATDNVINASEKTGTITGTNAAGAAVSVSIGGTAHAATVNGTTWSYTLGSADITAMGQGGDTITATAILPGGTAVATRSIVLDTVVPTAASAAQAIDDVGSVTGAIAAAGSTDDTTPTFSGSTEAGATVKVYDGATLLGSATAGNDGAWNFTPGTALGSGSHSVTWTATDAAGNTSGASPALAFTVDTAVPSTPASAATATDDVGSVTGAIAAGSTDDTTPTFSGSTEAGATVKVYDGATLLGSATAGNDGAWSFTPGTALGSGNHSITWTATDAAGNASGASPAVAFTVDTAAPSTPASAATATDDVGSVTGAIAAAACTDDTTPTFSGSTEAGATVKVYDGATLLGSATAGNDGAWSFTPGTALTAGSHSITWTATDAAGNTSGASPALAFTVDTAVPGTAIATATDDLGSVTGAIAAAGSTDDTIPTFSGSTEAGATVKVYDGETLLGSATADGEGSWSFAPEADLVDGEHSITWTATDAAGNTSGASPSVAFTVDTAAPSTPPSAALATDDLGSVTGTIASGTITDDPRPSFSGSTEAGATVKVYDGETLLGSATADGEGSWSFAPEADLVDGEHSITWTATDAAGNASGASPALDFNVLEVVDKVQNPGASDDFSVSIATDDTLGDITVISSIPVKVSLDVRPGCGDVVNLSNADILVHASASADGGLTGAALDLQNAHGTIGDITVTASGNSSDALANISGDATVNGDITVTASGVSASAEADITGLTLNDSNISVTASGASSDAAVNASDIHGTIGDITVTATGNSSDAHANISGDATVNGDIAVVSASGVSSDAQADITGLTLADSNIIVTAYRSSDASLSMWDIHGTVGHAVTESEQVHYQSLNGGIVVQTLYDANDDATNAHARADIRFSADATLNGDIVVHAEGDGASAFARVTLDGEFNGAYSVVAEENANAGLALTGGVDGLDLGTRSLAIDADNNNSSLALNLDNVTVAFRGDASVIASALGAEASVFFSGDSAANFAGDLSVSATGVYSSANLETSTSWGDTASVNFNDATLDVSASGRQSHAGLYLANATGTLGDVSVGATQDLAHTNASINSTLVMDYSNVTVEASGFSSDAWLNLGAGNDVTGTVDSVSVTASGESSDARLDLNLNGTLGDVSVTASGSADSNRTVAAADAVIFSGSGTVTLDHSALSVIASGVSAEASLSISDAIGTLDSLSVHAEGHGADVQAFVTATGNCGDVLTVAGDINVTATGTDSQANAYLSGVALGGGSVSVSTGAGEDAYAWARFNGLAPGEQSVGQLLVTAGDSYGNAGILFNNWNGSLDATDLTITGDIEVNALGDGSSAGIYGLNDFGSITLQGADIGVAAAGNSTDASVSLDAVSGSVGAINVSASGQVGWSQDVHALASVSGGADGLTITGDIIVGGDASSGYACADLSGVTLAGGDVRVYTADGGEGWNLQSIATIALAAGQSHVENLSAIAGHGGSLASIDFADGANLSVAGDITVSATAGDDRASIKGLGSADAVVLHGGDITVAADGDWSTAALAIANASGDVGLIGVSAGGYVGDAQLHLDLNGTVTLDNSDIRVIASGNSANAQLLINNAAGTAGDITVTASNNRATANFSLDAQGSLTLGGDIGVAANGTGSHASASLDAVSGSVGAINVIADGNLDWSWNSWNSSKATLSVSASSDGLTITDDITVGGTGYRARASADLSGVTLSGGDLRVYNDITPADGGEGMHSWAAIALADGPSSVHNLSATTGQSQDARARIEFAAGADLTVTGDISVNVDSNGVYSSAAINFGDGANLSVAGDISVNVDSNGVYSSAAINFGDGANLSVTGDITVNVSAGTYRGQARLTGLAGAAAVALHGGDISVAADGDGSSASLSIANANGDVGLIDVSAGGGGDANNADLALQLSGAVASVNVSASGYYDSNARLSLDLNGTVGDISVTASGNGSWGGYYRTHASADIHSSSGTVTLDNSVISVNATGKSADAYVRFHGGTASGAVSSIAVVAGGNDASADLRLCFDGTAGNIAVTASGTSSEAQTSVWRSSDGMVTLDSSVISVLASGTNSDAGLTLTRGNVHGSVANTDIRATGNSADARFMLYTAGTVGDISVSAAGDAAHARATVRGSNDGNSGPFTLDHSAISVSASGSGRSTEANLFIINAVGSADSIGVSAGGYDSHANADVNIGGTVGAISVTATGYYAKASAVVFSSNPTADVTLHNSTINVVASGFSSDATLLLDNPYTGSNHHSLLGSVDSITVSASATSTDANLALDFSGTLGDVSVTASGNEGNSNSSNAMASADIYSSRDAMTLVDSNISVNASGASAEAYLRIANAAGTADTITVTASSYDAHATLSTAMVDFTLDGNLSVSATHDYSTARADLSGITLAGGDLTVSASGASSDAQAVLDLAAGDGESIGLLSASASGYSADALIQLSGSTFLMDLTVTDGITLSAGGDHSTATFAGLTGFRSITLGDTQLQTGANIDVCANGDFANALLDLTAANISGTVDSVTVSSGGSADATLWLNLNGTLGNVSVTASGQSSDALATISDQTGLALNDSNISVRASGYSSEASVDIMNASGTLGDITVSAAESSHAHLKFSNDSLSAMGDITVSATGINASAVAEVYSSTAIVVSGNIEVSTSSSSAFASADLALVELGGGDLIVSADGEDAEARVNLSMAAGANSIGLLSVSAGGLSSSAVFNVSADTIGDVDLTITDGITVSAAGNSSDVHTYNLTGANSITLGDAQLQTGATIDISAGGDHTQASLDLGSSGNVSGSVDSIRVSAGGSGADAALDLGIDGDVGNISVAASGLYARASADVYRSVALDHSVLDVSASGLYSTANLNLDSNPVTGSVASLAVDASNRGADARLNLDLNGSMGDISVTASGRSAEASVDIWSSTGAVTFDNSDISIATSSHVSAEAHVDIANAAGTLHDISIAAHASGNVANLSMDFTGHIGGDISVSALDNNASADLSIYSHSGAFERQVFNKPESNSLVGDEKFEITIGDTTLTFQFTHGGNEGMTELIRFLNFHSPEFGLTPRQFEYTWNTATINIQYEAFGDVPAATVKWNDVSATPDTNSIFWDEGVAQGVITFDGGNLGVTAQESSADARLDMWTPTTGSIGEIAVVASNNGSADASLTKFTGTISGTIGVAADTGGSANLDLRSHPGWSVRQPDVTASGVAIDHQTVSVSAGTSGDAWLELGDGVGTITALNVVASDWRANAGASVDFSGEVGSISVLSNGGAEHFRPMAGYTRDASSSNLEMSAGAQQQVLINDNVRLYAETSASSLVEAGETYTLNLGTVTLSYTFTADDVAWANHLSMGHILAQGLREDADYAASGVVIDGYDFGKIGVVWDQPGQHPEPTLMSSATWINPGYTYHDGADGSGITVTGAVTVAATDTATGAELHLDNLVGGIDTLNVSATGYSSDVYATLRMDDTHVIAAAYVEAASRATATLMVDQNAHGGDVIVSGDGRVELTYGDQMPGAIALGGLHADDWGIADINLRAADLNNTFYPDAGSVDKTALQANMTEIHDFSTASDSINLEFRAHSADLVSPSFWYSSTSTSVPIFYAENEAAVGSVSALLGAASAAFSDDVSGVPAYYFGVFDGNGYLATDYNGSGISNLIKLDGVTSFDEINVATRTFADYGVWNMDVSDTTTDTRLGAQALDQLSISSNTYYGNNPANACADTVNQQTVLFENGRVGDITVTAEQNSTFIPDGGHNHWGGATGYNEYYHLSTVATVGQTGVGSCGDVGILDLRQSDITVSNSNNAYADLELQGATGSIDRLLVETTGTGNDFTNGAPLGALAHIDSFTGHLGDIQVFGQGSETATANINIDTGHDATLGALTAGMATFDQASNEVWLNATDNSTTNLYLDHAAGTVGDLRVEALDQGTAYASFILDGSIDNIDVAANRYDRNSSNDGAYYNDATACTDVTLTGTVGTLNVFASADLNGTGLADAHVIAGGSIDQIRVYASADSVSTANANAVVVAGGDIDYIDVNATADNASLIASAIADITTTGSVGRLRVSADSRGSSDANACTDITLHGSIGDITVYARERAWDDTGTAHASAALTGTVAFDSSAIVVESYGQGDWGQQHVGASFNVNGATGTIDSLTVSADATGDGACIDVGASTVIDNFTGTLGDITVIASGDATAGAYINHACNDTGLATFDANAYSNISVRASDNGSATLELLHAAGSVNYIDVVASAGLADLAANSTATVVAGDISRIYVGATAHVSTAGAIADITAGSIGSLSVSADSWSGDANACTDISLSGSIGDITVYANGQADWSAATAQASARLSGTVAFHDSAINVESHADACSGQSVGATLIVEVASGTIDSLTVTADSSKNDNACVDVGAHASLWNFNGTLGDITVSAAGSQDAIAYADAYVNHDAPWYVPGTVFTFAADVSNDISVQAADLGNATLVVQHAAGNVHSMDVGVSGHGDASAVLDTTGTIDNLSVSATNYAYGGGQAVADATAASISNLSLNAVGWYGGTSKAFADATATGDIHSVGIVAESCYAGDAHACADITAATMHDLSVSTNAIAPNIHYGTSTVADAHVTLSADGEYLDYLGINASSYSYANPADTNSAEISTANVDITQTTHGGNAYVTGSGAGADTVNLAYHDEAADKIYLGDLLHVQTAFTGNFNLTLDKADVDTAYNDQATLDKLVEIFGFNAANDTLTFGAIDPAGAGIYSEKETAVGDLATLLSDANTALGTSDYYFGVTGGNGYVAYDADHTGITTLVELHGVTEFDATKIHYEGV